jgi:hypothetical protein
MKKIYLLILLLGGLQITKAQTSSYALWYEYANGSFIKTSFSSLTDYNNYVSSSLPPLTTGGAQLGAKKGTIYYPPPGGSGIIKPYTIRNTITGSSGVSTPIPIGKILFTHTSTFDFLKNDTIMFALNYLSKNTNANKLAFFYNKNPNPTFIPVTNVNGTLPIQNEITSNTITYPQIRRYFSENPAIAIGSMMSTIGAGYLNGLVFGLVETNDNPRNIFLTLNTYANITSDLNETFKLVFLDSNNNVVSSETGSLINHRKLPSHDPNYELVTPECLKPSMVEGTIANYDIHFQNTGLGPAELVVTRTKLPDGYTVDEIINWNPTNVNGLTNWRIGGVSANPDFDVKASGEDANNVLKIEFERKPTRRAAPTTDPARSEVEVLVGTKDMPDPLSDTRTMGDFQFSLRLKTPPTIPIDLVSQTKIVFDTNAPVQTNDAIIRVRECCTCKEPSTNTISNTPPRCKWCKKSKFIRWLFCENC